MTNHINKRSIGVSFILLSMMLWLVDRLTHNISTMLGELICRDHHMHTVDGMIGNASCGLNIDMHLAYLLFTVLIVGIVLYIASHKEIA